MLRRHVYALVHGRVQGVAFRYYTCKRAQKLGLSGWVRNRADGSVELVCAGYAEDVTEFIEWLQHGPVMAQVRWVDWQELNASEESSFLELDFQIRPTVY